MNAQKSKELLALVKNLKVAKPICKNGSCGYVAYYISQYLTRHNIPHTICMFGIGKMLNIHVMVRVGDYYVDKNGFQLALYYRLMKRRDISIGVLSEYLKVRSMWNYKFDFNVAPLIGLIILNEETNSNVTTKD